LDSHVKRIEEGWVITKEKATTRLQFLQKTKDAWNGYASGLEDIVVQFEKAEEEMKKVKKRFHLTSASEDLERRQKIYNENKGAIETLYKSIQDNYDIMTMTLPDDKKDFVKKEVKAITEKLECMARFGDKVKKIEDFVANLSEFDLTLKSIDKWMKDSEQQLKDIKLAIDKMTPEDRVSLTMELQEDIAAKVKVISENIQKEEGLLPQGMFSMAIVLYFNPIT
jgi:succinate dehydrogenase/fumarate reductase-like Fe-S protein